MVDILFKRFWLWLLLLSSAVGFSQVFLANAPRFAKTGQTLTLQAFDDNAPAAIVVAWQSDTASGTLDMTQNTDNGRWTTALPGTIVQGSRLNITVTAEYDPQPKTSSMDCTIYISEKYTTLKPQPLALEQTILAQKKWNDNNQAFGLIKPENGPPLGPASIAYNKGHIYILDSAKNRVLCFDKNAQQETVATVPSSLASDLIVDPADGSLLVISQLEDKVYRFHNRKLQKTESASMKKQFAYPAKFTYNAHSKKLYAHKDRAPERLVDVTPRKRNLQTPQANEQKTPQLLTDVQDCQLLIKTNTGPEIFSVTFDQPVGYIDETLLDDNGIAWVLFTMQDDYRVRRLARIDTQQTTAETAQINIWFSFDATRRMTLTDTGVAFMAGDTVHGRIVLFDYAGDL